MSPWIRTIALHAIWSYMPWLRNYMLDALHSFLPGLVHSTFRKFMNDPSMPYSKAQSFLNPFRLTIENIIARIHTRRYRDL